MDACVHYPLGIYLIGFFAAVIEEVGREKRLSLQQRHLRTTVMMLVSKSRCVESMSEGFCHCAGAHAALDVYVCACVYVCVCYQLIAALRIHEEATDDRNLGECVCVRERERKSARDAGRGNMRI